MAHNITAIIIKGEYDEEIAKEYDLRSVKLEYGLTMFLIDIYYINYWQHALQLEKHLRISPPHDLLIPTEEAIAYIVKEITSEDKEYALIHTDYWGGEGNQFAAIMKGRDCVDENITTINAALKYLGVFKKAGLDEFDSVGLSNYRRAPIYLEKYADLCDELGL